jgi:radical SAM superfamily enzyme YgiQ (UPF0313 family)
MSARGMQSTKRRALLVHVNGMERVTPLAGGYLKAYAMTSPEIERDWEVDLYSTYGETISSSKLVADILQTGADLVGFSAYVWNAGLIRRVLPVLRSLMPRAHFVLGGTEVMNCAPSFVAPDWENVVVCNGEGEKTFRDLLLALSHDPVDYSRVGGISYFAGGELQTTKAYPRIQSLDEIPSPYLLGYFNKRDYSVALFETNRGCPYKCEFCYWGAAVGQKIHRLGKERVLAEIEHLGENKARAVYICDANFGIFPEDPAFARKFVETRERTRYPRFVRYSSAKNNPTRALEVATTLAKGGVLSVQPLSLQTLSPRALKLARRESISQELYFDLQTRTNQLGIASFVELIWPMPGETLASFKNGVQQLCRMDAQALSVYPLVWLNNTGYKDKEKEFGIVLLECGDPSGTTKTVIQTHDVSFEQWVEGMMYTNAAQLLHGCRALYHTAAVVDGLGLATRQQIFERFQKWMDAQRGTHLSRVWHLGRQKIDEIYSTLSWPGHLIEAALHFRTEFDDALVRFVAENDDMFGGDCARVVTAAFEFDLLTRPYAYSNTPIVLSRGPSVLRVLETHRHGWLIESPYNITGIVEALRHGAAPDLEEKPIRIAIDHRRNQMYRMPNRTQKEYWDECRMFALEMGNHYPTWKIERSDADGAAARDTSVKRTPQVGVLAARAAPETRGDLAQREL